ncbi:hypothetical protein CEXT_271391 [Caerostris extrusa]|uniref:Uncharacterized protein n=1 Tax=Caerostris extrusa TaxID=172846 RepID=A0AAV4U202_CAEEX|nr:hypothetical protein CEXT_271391 [Caerostris extrusa]
MSDADVFFANKNRITARTSKRDQFSERLAISIVLNLPMGTVTTYPHQLYDKTCPAALRFFRHPVCLIERATSFFHVLSANCFTINFHDLTECQMRTYSLPIKIESRLTSKRDQFSERLAISIVLNRMGTLPTPAV